MTQESKPEGHILEDADLIRAAYPLAAPFLQEATGTDWKENGLTGQRAAFILSREWNKESSGFKPVQGIDEKGLSGHTLSKEAEDTLKSEKHTHTLESKEVEFPQEAATLLSQEFENVPAEEILPETESKITETPEEKPQALISQSPSAQGELTPKAKPTRQKVGQKKKTLSNAPESTEEKVDFYHWLESLQSGKSGTPRKGKSGVTGSVPKVIKGSFSEKARKSQELKEEIASETLAALLAAQGHRDKAIHMYEKLMEKYPEKKLSFATLIEKLNS